MSNLQAIAVLEKVETHGSLPTEAKALAIKALRKQSNIKNCIERLNQIEYKEILWSNDNLIQLLSSFLVEGGKSDG